MTQPLLKHVHARRNGQELGLELTKLLGQLAGVDSVRLAQIRPDFYIHRMPEYNTKVLLWDEQTPGCRVPTRTLSSKYRSCDIEIVVFAAGDDASLESALQLIKTQSLVAQNERNVQWPILLVGLHDTAADVSAGHQVKALSAVSDYGLRANFSVCLATGKGVNELREGIIALSLLGTVEPSSGCVELPPTRDTISGHGQPRTVACAVQ
jgi:hypothetical protein